MKIKDLPVVFIKDILLLSALVAVTIAVTYFIPGRIATVWYIITLALYAFSKNEALWLAFFLATVDGFMGFMGLYSLTLKIIPGLPGIELAQFYIVIAVIKSIVQGWKAYIFYNRFLQVLLLYVIFMIIWGQVSGYSGELNAYFRVLKMVFPLALFYTIPHLFKKAEVYDRFFSLVFFIFLVGFGTQIFSLLTGIVPLENTVESEDLFSEPGSFRGFYNAGSTLIALFGALAYLSADRQKVFNRLILYIVVFATLAMAVVSATRGWILGIGLIIIIQLVFLFTVGRRKVPWLGIFIFLVFLTGLSNPKIKEQIAFSKERVLTLSSIAEGDISAEKTLQRLNKRGPQVIKIWKEKPIFGWGFSDTSWKYGDGHVGNQNILLYSGIVGLILITGFLLYFSYKLTIRYLILRRYRIKNQLLLVFPVFLLGWFIIHSTSGQQFGFSGLPLHIIPQAVFFSYGGFIYAQTKSVHNGKTV